MEITNVKIFKARGNGPLLAFANVVFDNKFIIKGIRIIETEKHGRFIAMPARPVSNQKYHFKDVCHPLNAEMREELTEAIFKAYDEFLETEE